MDTVSSDLRNWTDGGMSSFVEIQRIADSLILEENMLHNFRNPGVL
jgi:hypothetical protein